MAAKRKKSRAKQARDAYEQAMMAEGAPLALDLLGLGDTIRSVVRGRRRKTTTTRKKTRAKAKMSRANKKSAVRKTHRRKRARRA